MLSESALIQVCGDEAMETAHFAEMLDKCFDALNVHNYSDGATSLKSFQLPYTSGEDNCLKVNVRISSTVLMSLIKCSESDFWRTGGYLLCSEQSLRKLRRIKC